MSLRAQIDQHGFVIAALASKASVEQINSIVDKYLPENYKEIDVSDYRKCVLDIQNKVNTRKIYHYILDDNWSDFEDMMGGTPFSVTAVAHIRCVRPDSKEKMEFLGFHREAFYSDGDYINHQVNIQVPIRNYSKQTSMYYVPNSHLIADEDIQVEKMDSEYSGVERFSTGHKIGLSYNPKLITGGVSLDQAERFDIQPDQYIAFSSKLLHGAGSNLSQDVRVTMDFGIIPNDKMGDVKKFHFSSYSNGNSPYETPIRS